jgi:hypothetical protein
VGLNLEVGPLECSGEDKRVKKKEKTEKKEKVNI